MQAPDDQRAAFAAVLAVQIEGWNRTELAARIAAEAGESVSPQAIGNWLAAKDEPSRNKIFAAERVLGMPPGSLSRCFGYLPLDADDDQSVEAAIMADGMLDRRLKASLIAAVKAGRRG